MNDSCTVYRTMDCLSKRWAVMIMMELYKGSREGDGWMRFNTIKDSMSHITPKVLSERLREMESKGIVEHRLYQQSFPTRSKYRLTECGLELMDIIHDMKMWALKWLFDNPECGKQDCRNCTL